MQVSQITQILAVGAGGFVGASARYLMSGAIHRLVPASSFPIGTLVVNSLGCLVIGLVGGLMEARHVLGPNERLFLLIGVLGGFTTFSTFAWETLGLAEPAQFGRAALNVALQVTLGLGAAWIGIQIARSV